MLSAGQDLSGIPNVRDHASTPPVSPDIDQPQQSSADSLTPIDSFQIAPPQTSAPQNGRGLSRRLRILAARYLGFGRDLFVRAYYEDRGFKILEAASGARLFYAQDGEDGTVIAGNVYDLASFLRLILNQKSAGVEPPETAVQWPLGRIAAAIREGSSFDPTTQTYSFTLMNYLPAAVNSGRKDIRPCFEEFRRQEGRELMEPVHQFTGLGTSQFTDSGIVWALETFLEADGAKGASHFLRLLRTFPPETFFHTLDPNIRYIEAGFRLRTDGRMDAVVLRAYERSLGESLSHISEWVGRPHRSVFEWSVSNSTQGLGRAFNLKSVSSLFWDSVWHSVYVVDPLGPVRLPLPTALIQSGGLNLIPARLR